MTARMLTPGILMVEFFFDGKAARYLMYCLVKPYIDGLTLSGGDPMHPANREMVTLIAEHVKKITHKTIWMYTGYLYEEIEDEPVMQYIDVVVDGIYDKTRPPALYRGSDNQRIIRRQLNLRSYRL